MSYADFAALLPLLITSTVAVILMMAIAIRRNHKAAAAISLIGLAAALVSLAAASSVLPRQVTKLFILDSYSFLYMAILLFAAAFVFLFAYDYLKCRQEQQEEFYLLVLLATTGAMALAVSRNFVSFFLGLELLSVALYALIAYVRSESISIEAGIKYLVLAASSSSVLLFGLALIYAESGSMELSQFTTAMSRTTERPDSLLLMTGLMLVLTGVGFKLAIVPFHLWTPDVYEGAPLPVTAFIATVSKGGMFALLLRWFHVNSGALAGAPALVLSVIAVASMLAGNLLALRQTNVKRILAYSSIAHMGYLLVALLAGGALGAPAATYYLAAYMVTILGAFGVMTVLSGPRWEAASILFPAANSTACGASAFREIGLFFPAWENPAKKFGKRFAREFFFLISSRQRSWIYWRQRPRGFVCVPRLPSASIRTSRPAAIRTSPRGTIATNLELTGKPRANFTCSTAVRDGLTGRESARISVRKFFP